MLKKQVAIITPWDGRNKVLLTKAIKSIDQQTYTNIEKILITDGFSVDEEFKSRFADWRFLENSGEIRGPAATRNVAFKSLSDCTNYVLLADADDVSHPSRIEVLIQEMERLDLDIIGSQGVIIHDSKLFNDVIIFPYPFMSLNTRTIKRKLIHGRNGLLAPSVLIKREVIHELGGYSINLLRGEDLEFFQRAANHGFRMGNTSYVLYGYRTNWWTSYARFKADWSWSGREINLKVAYFGHLLRRLWAISGIILKMETINYWKLLSRD